MKLNETELRRLPGRIKKQEIALRKAIRDREQAEVNVAACKARVVLTAWQNGIEGFSGSNAESRREIAELAVATDTELIGLRAALNDALDTERRIAAEADRLRGVQSNLREYIRFNTARMNAGGAL